MPVKVKWIQTMHGFVSVFALAFVSVFVPVETVQVAATVSDAEAVPAAEAALAVLVVHAAANAF
jgi:hypothetical protein